MTLWSDAVGEVLADTSGNEERSWGDHEGVLVILNALVASGEAYGHAGSGGFFYDEEGEGAFEGPLTGVTRTHTAISPDDAPTLSLCLGNEILQVTPGGLHLTYLPHRNGPDHAIFFLHARPANAAATTWSVTRVGEPTLALAIGRKDGLGLATSRWGPKSRRTLLSYGLWLRQALMRPNGGVYRTEEEARHDYEEAGKTELKANYLAYRGARSTGAMTQEDVNFVAFRALNLQLHPTMELLREVHGSGSPTALHPKLKAFFQTLFENHLVPAPAANVPPAVARLYEQMMEEARQDAQAAQTRRENALHLAQTAHDEALAKLAEDRTAFAEEQVAANAVMKQLRAANAELAEDAVRSDKVATEYRETVQNLYAELGDVHAVREKLEAELVTAKHGASRLADEATALNKRVDAREVRITALELQLDECRKESADLRLANAKAESLHLTQRAAQAKEIAELTRVRDLVVHQNATARKALDASNGKVAAMEAERDRLNQEVGRLSAALESARIDRERLSEELGPLRRQVTELVGELRGIALKAAAPTVALKPLGEDTIP
jgi:uncharacterized coiled-coil DUF342 family protein